MCMNSHPGLWIVGTSLCALQFTLKTPNKQFLFMVERFLSTNDPRCFHNHLGVLTGGGMKSNSLNRFDFLWTKNSQKE